MSSTFSGLETARRGMFTQQSALHTTGQNISNANTPGYSRHRINFEETEPYPPAGRNRPQIPGQVGTGVKAGSVQRVRESFIDVQYRSENTKLGYWESRSSALANMEEIMNEPSENGLAKTMDRFWQSLQDLAVNPNDSGARSVVRQRGVAVAETFHYMSNSLTAIQNDLGSQIDITVKEVNSIATQISNINKQISEIEPHGYLANDLYDNRDVLLDRLSELVPVETERVKTGGNALDIADGMLDVYVMDKDGKRVQLVDGTSSSALSVTPADIGVTSNSPQPVTGISLGGTPLALAKQGKLQGLVDSYGYDDNGTTKGSYPEMMDNLDKMAFDFMKRFNEVHENGHTIENPSATGVKFFDQLTDGKDAAKLISVSEDIMKDLNKIAASTVSGQAGNGENALALAGVQNENFSTIASSNVKGTLRSFYQGVIGKMAVDAQEATRLENNSDILRQSVEERRQSVSGVSLDEEMTNMIKFQHAYNASSRNITTIDEMLDKIINGMGRVGR
ncbi:flagellar hook-associated protein FlgK [Bacillus marinisedimentorum]|uniref:flagellar hook-associated protein FlgK n=1 Tax=Bacillus marinisedimentorum TaxID=1821260 RepID=UPI0007DFFC97|nr:flagellar hook-associated protein FlgK [Bacillus marinisedimentorum]